MSMFSKSVPIGKVRITTTRVIETDMTVAREFFKLIGDAPESVAEFIKAVVTEANKLQEWDAEG